MIEFIMRWSKDITYSLIIVFVVGWSTYGTYLHKEVISYQKTEIIKLKANIEYLEDLKPTVISCANNQRDYLRLLNRMEKQYKMPKGLLKQVAYHESNFNPNALSHKGAVGIMQLIPKWHPSVNARDPYAAIPYAAKWLTELKRRFGDWELALAAWNWGPGNMSKYSFYQAPRETKNFVKKVMKGIIT